MTRDLLKKWTAALRSGKYDQTQQAYYRPETQRYCALGVLGDVVRPGDHANHTYDAVSADHLDGDTNLKVVHWNDRLGLTFPEIADALENLYNDPLLGPDLLND